MCPVNAISLTLNGERHVPVQAYEAFPEIIESTTFDPTVFDWSLKDFVIENCPGNVISYDEEAQTLVIDYALHPLSAVRGRQQWRIHGGATVGRHRYTAPKACVEGCFACADICPTRALHVNDEGELVLADYYCIKCGACMQICPVKPIIEMEDVVLQSQGVTQVKSVPRITNAEALPIYVERWRVRHHPVQSGTWIQALAKLADDKASMVEIERKRAIKRRDLIVALKGDRELQEREARRRDELLRALKGGEEHVDKAKH